MTQATTAAELERLVAIAAAERHAIADVSRAVRQLEQTQAAKAELQRLPADVLRVALEARRLRIVGEVSR